MSIFWLSRLIHSDLKPENIVLQQAGKTSLKVNNIIIVFSVIDILVIILAISPIVFKVIDFGTSCYEGSSQSKAPDYVQTRYYRAPEVSINQSTNQSFDQ